MRRKLFYIFICLAFLTLPVYATIEIQSRQLTTGDGISNNSIRYLLQDSKGFIWMSSLNGLNRYDGNSFISFFPNAEKISLADHRIAKLYEDRNGLLWITTTLNLMSCYDLKKDCFVDFTGCGEYNQNYRDCLEASDGSIWLWNDGNGCRKVSYKNGSFSSMVYKEELGNIFTNQILYVYEDSRQRIWAGTSEGLAELQGDKFVLIEDGHDAFQCMEYEGKLFFLSANGQIYLKVAGNACRLAGQIVEDSQQTIVYGSLKLQHEWIVFTNKGGFSFNMNTGKLSRSKNLDIKNGLVVIDNKGNYWVHNRTGKVWYVNAKNRHIKTFQLIPADIVSYIDEERFHVVHDSRDIVWISTYGNGLFAYELKTDEMQHFKADSSGDGYIGSNFLQYVMEDRVGGIWVSSEYAGVSRLTILNEGAIRIFPEDQKLTDRSNTVRMLTKMNNGDVWIGTRQGGIYVYDADLKPKGERKHLPSSIYAVVEDAEGKVWYGSRGKGVQIDDRWYTYNSMDSTSLGDNNIFTMHRDQKDRVWVGTFGGGLNLAIKKEGKYEFQRFLNKYYSQSRIRSILEDNNGWMWVGTSDGVYVFHPDSLIVNPENYITYNYKNGKLNSSEIKCIYQDKKGRIWIGTTGSGFATTSVTNGYNDLIFKHYDTKDGLVNNMVQSIVEDESGKLWIATEYGISHFDTEKGSFKNFFFSAYALGNVYSENSVCTSENGKLLFGSNHGLVVITPSLQEEISVIVPQVSFTDLKINGISMHPGDVDSPLNQSLVYTDAIKLKYFQNSFVIDFSLFDYKDASGTKYTYKLDNYDKTWSIPSSLNFAAYKNLNPGTYTLRVKACNSAGIWGDEETLLSITITPPFWKTSWAFIIYLTLTIVILYFAYGLARNITRLRNRIQVEKQLTEYKLVFFTNISHEFRTPLTLIQGVLEKIRDNDKLTKEMGSSLKVLEKSTNRMLRLINQLLEFRKMQNNKLALSLEETDVIAFLYEIFLSFNDAAESKKMDFKFKPSVASYKMFVDKGNLDKVTYNLLSNAFKYTPSNGKIIFTVTIDENKQKLYISVSDTGVGIPKDKRDELFKRFMQSSFSGSSVGVGLHLTHELVSVHKGSIEYCENIEGGSIFTVTLPLGISVYEEKDFLIPHNVLMEEERKRRAEVSMAEKMAMEEELQHKYPLNKRRILIIEDDNDVRDFLKEEIGQYFEVDVVTDGLSGLEKAKELDIDLIVCDVLMPGMTGFEVVRKLKTDFNTSHIPIVLLTALSSVESHLEGVESGADAYITKPFSPKLLLARIFNLIEQREKLRERFSNDPNMIRPTICTTDKDKDFAENLLQVMEKELANSQFNVDEFASIMGYGRTVFYRKVRGVTGYSPNEYIRIMRMKKAAELLVENKYTIAEISYQVGISDPFYFSKCFKQQFGVSPSVYVKNKGAE